MQLQFGQTEVFALWPVITINRQACDNPACPEIHTFVALTCAGFFIGLSF